MKQWIKNNYLFIILFFFVFCAYTIFFFPNNYGDPMANYGFSYAIIRGEIPYVDFNMISTPLYAFVMSLGLLIWNNYSMFLLEQSLLVTIMFYLLYKMYGIKSFALLIVLIVVFGFLGMYATYNFFVFFLLVVLLYLEKKYPEKDYLIGTVLGLSVLAKHTIGGLFLLPGLFFYCKQPKKMGKRFLAVSVVGIVFVLYLLITGSFQAFFDLCVFGLFDFSSSNGSIHTNWFLISVLCFIGSIYLTIRGRKDISNWYLLTSFSVVVPLFDLCHFSYYIFCLGIQLLPYIKKYENYIGKFCFYASLGMSCIWFSCYYFYLHPIWSSDIPHFEFLLDGEYNHMNSINFYHYFDEYPDALILSYAKLQYDISIDRDLDYFDVFLYGNHGYNGTQKIINKISEMHDTYIIVNIYDYRGKGTQFNKEAVKYVMDNCEKVESKYIFEVYYNK